MHEFSSLLYIGHYESDPGDPPDEADDFLTEASRVRRNLITPVLADYPEIRTTYLGIGSRIRSSNDVSQVLNTLKAIEAPGFVIADLSCLDRDSLKAAVERQIIGRPTILLLPSNSFMPPIDIGAARWITYNSDQPSDAQETLASEIARVLQAFGFSISRPHARLTGTEMADRLDAVVTALGDLRINSITERIDELRNISAELRVLRENDEELTTKILTILGDVDRVIGSSRLGKLVLSGALAALVTGGGLASAAVFSLSIAVWEGPEYFRAALDKYLSARKPAPAKTRSSKKRISKT